MRLKQEPEEMHRVGWVYHPFFLRHDTGTAHLESAVRLEAIAEALAGEKWPGRLQSIPFDPIGVETLAWVHEPAYVKLVQMACEQGMGFIGSEDTHVGRESFDVALLAVAGVAGGCSAVMAGDVGRVFCAVRPPGHHAGRAQASGYCLFNNTAIAAEYLIRTHDLERVAIVDWDVHHGNGTQQIFEERCDVLYVSLHEAPPYLFPYTGYAREGGVGSGKGFTLNVPMRPGSGDAAYRQAFSEKVIPRLDEFGPQFVLVSAGFDAARGDRTADIDLQPESFDWMTRELCDVADRHAEGRLVSVLEGGYEPSTLKRCVIEHVRAMWDTQ
jgi:acetoin utilization deacetylase AcuC-like enzyme